MRFKCGSFKHIAEFMGDVKVVVYVMINPKDDANQGNDLLAFNRSIFLKQLVSF